MEDTNAVAGPGHYEWLSYNSPLSNQRADRLAAALAGTGPGQVLDLGCGWGELLLRVLAAAPRATGIGVDTDARCLARGRANSIERRLDGRVTFVEGGADASQPAADVVICVGASHAFGDTAAALHALRRTVRPGGRLLFGEGFWERTPTAEQAEIRARADEHRTGWLRGYRDVLGFAYLTLGVPAN